MAHRGSYSCRLIAHCHPDRVGVEGQCPIVAESLTEFLKKALDSNGRYWWNEPGFAGYGDAITRMKRMARLDL